MRLEKAKDRTIRWEKVNDLINLAIELSSSAEGMTLDELQSDFNVSRKTAERMRDAVEASFGPLDLQEDGRKIRFRLTTRGLMDFFTAPTATELTELENAARALEAAQAHERAAQLLSLRAKIGARLREPDKKRLTNSVANQLCVEALACQVGPRPMADSSVLSLLREALLQQKIVRFDYGGDDDKPPRWRRVVPYGLLFGPRYYLVAGIKSRRGAVLYRLDGIHNLMVTDEPGKAPDDFDLKTYAELSFGVFHEPPQDIELRFAPSAARDARAYLFHPTQILADETDGSLTVRFHAGGMREMAHHLMTWGQSLTIIEPPALAEEMRKQVEALYAHHVTDQSSAGSKRLPSTRNSSKSSSRKVPITSVKGS